MFKAWAQLVRLPNVFTAIADVLAGALLALGRWPEGEEIFALLGACLASACLYSAGMMMNDLCDVEEDQRDRPFRPIPSGRISFERARTVCFALMCLGVLLAKSWESSEAVFIAASLFLAIIAYNRWLKKTWFGPVAMGACRFLNVLLGAAHFGALNVQVLSGAALVGSYIVGVTVFAKSEATQSKRRGLVFGAVIVLVVFVSLLLLYLNGILGQPSKSSMEMLLLPLILGVVLARFLIQAIIDPAPWRVQVAIKTCIFGLIGLDAILAVAAVGPTGLLLLLLLIPTILMGQVIYST